MTKRILTILVLVLTASACLAGDGPLFLWQAEKDGATLHLLGSFHAGREGWYPLDERIEQAFTAADTVACELNLADMGLLLKVNGLVMKEGMYPEGESLKDHVSEETWAQLVAVEGLPVPPTMLERMRPGLAATMYAQTLLSELDLDPQQGIDMTLLKRAAADRRPVISLETPEQQVALIFGPDAVIDELMLAEALDETPESVRAFLDQLVTAWQTGDPEAMETAYRSEWHDDERMIRFHEELLVDRNRGMADRLDRAGGHWFVVVGALHLCGDEGVPALLADRGWRVRQVGLE